MNAWGALQYVGTGLSLIAFAVAAILFAYRARLAHRAEIIRSAPEKERLEAIAITAEFFRVDVSGLTRAQKQEIVLTQIHARAGSAPGGSKFGCRNIACGSRDRGGLDHQYRSRRKEGRG